MHRNPVIGITSLLFDRFRLRTRALCSNRQEAPEPITTAKTNQPVHKTLFTFLRDMFKSSDVLRSGSKEAKDRGLRITRS